MAFSDTLQQLFSRLAPMNNAGGLLGPQDALAAQQQGLLGLGTGLLSAGGPSRYPISFGQAASGAALQSNAMQNNAIDSALKRQLVASEIYARMQPPAGELKLIPVMTKDGPRLVPERAAAGMQPYDPNANKPLDSLGQLAQDYRNGLITKAEYDARAKKLTELSSDAADKPLTPDQLRLMQVNGQMPPIGTTLGQAAKMGASVIPVQDPLDKTLDPSDREKFRLPDGSKLPNNITTQRQALAAGAQTTTQAEVDRQNAEKTAKQTLDQLEGMALDSKQGGVLLGNPASVPMQSLNQSGQAVGHFLGTEASGQRQKYVDARTALATSLATAENPTDQVARESAIKRYLALIPDINTPEPEARSKFELLRSRLGGTSPAAPTPSGIKFLGFEGQAPTGAPIAPPVSPFTSVNQFSRR
jgi:hypothetical protein